MIRHMDNMLRLWADELHGDQPSGGGSAGNMIAMLIECRGELIRGTPGSRVLLDESADIELIVNKHLPDMLATVVQEHYCNRDSLLSQKISQCRCSRDTYYSRLHEAHLLIETMLRCQAA